MAREASLHSRLRLGQQLIAARRFEEARSLYREVCAQLGTDADCWFTLGAISGMLGRLDEAVACCEKAVAIAPRHAGAWFNLGIAHRDSGQLEKSIDALRKVLQLDVRHREAAATLAYVLAALHRHDEADAVLRQILREFPEHAGLHATRGSVMQVLNHSEAAIDAYAKALALRHPEPSAIHENMAVALCQQGRYRESIEHFEAALKIEPENARCCSNLLLTLHYLPVENPQSLLDRHRAWPGNARHVPGRRAATERPSARPERLRIGYVSSDLRRHSVAHFIEPLLRHHDAARYEITCHYSHPGVDETTSRLRKLAHRWRDVAALDDEKLYQTIVADRIDILVDLNGHTQGNRLAVFARRAAPVQLSFIGYPDTTGVSEMDYRLTDAIADPPGAEAWCTERLVRLPECFLCYQPPALAPAVVPPPCEKNSFVTFGSFNNLAKINSAVIAVWARLLREVPHSRLVIKNPSFTEQATRERYYGLFAVEGIPGERLDLLEYVPDGGAHLATYARMDIALDTFPYNGTATTCEALWMGVPVVTLRGARHSGRVGASLLAAAGLAGWIADTPEDYVKSAVTLARDHAALARLRSGLRERIAQSRLCQAPGYTRSVENAFEEMYREHARSHMADVPR